MTLQSHRFDRCAHVYAGHRCARPCGHEGEHEALTNDGRVMEMAAPRALLRARHTAGVAFAIVELSENGAVLVGALAVRPGDLVHVTLADEAERVASVIDVEPLDALTDRIVVRFVAPRVHAPITQPSRPVNG